jgi:two-component system, OmpR family, phosphate regulon sensor histidine kinase PhoR
MSRLRWLGILMLVAIVGITSFQFYWLRQNYAREKKTTTINAEVAFQETIMQLQVAKLKLDDVQWNGKDSGGNKLKIITHENNGGRMQVRLSPGKEIISTINVVRGKLIDSLKKNPDSKPGMITISMSKTSTSPGKDSIQLERHIREPEKGNHFFNLLYGVDSLQDSLRLSEIDSAYSKVLQEEKLNIPFSIIQTNSIDTSDAPMFKQVTVGLTKPVTYKLQLGNMFPYLLKQITQPILFSILLLGITILSFVLLYKNLLKQRKLAELKNEFISNITHELKTPIATVGVAIEALKNFNAMDNPQRTKEYLDISQNELQRLSLLVDKVLKLSMFEKKEMELKFETVDLKGVVEEVVDSLRLQLEKNRAVVTVTHEGNMTLQGDRLHLLSVVFNLLDNAIKYSNGEPSIRLAMKEKNDILELRVTDNGIGIAPEYKNKIFDKFFRIPHGDTHNAKGYGLGLSYVAQVVQKHNGTITVDSQPGTGTTFTITLSKGAI